MSEEAFEVTDDKVRFSSTRFFVLFFFLVNLLDLFENK